MALKTFIQPKSIGVAAAGITGFSSVNAAWASGLGIEGYGLIWASVLGFILISTGVAFLTFYIVARLCRRIGTDPASDSTDTTVGCRFIIPLCCASLSVACFWGIAFNKIVKSIDTEYVIAETYKESNILKQFVKKEYSSMPADKLSNLGQELVQKKEFTQALAAFLVALKKDKQNKILLNDISETYNKLETYILAEKYARKALKLDPEYAKAHVSLGKALICRFKNEEGLSHEQQAIRYGDNSADAYFYIGLAHERLNRKEEALKAYEQVRKIEPDYPKLQERLSTVTGNK